MKKKCSIFLVIFVLFFSFFARAEETVDNNKKKDKINIKSDKLEYVYKENEEVAVFTGNVELKQGELTVYSDIMNMYSQGKRAIGENNVKVIIDNENENRVLTSGYIEYHRDEEYALLKKNPKMIVINKKQKSKKSNKTEMDSTETKSAAADKDKNKVKDFKELIVIGEVMEMFSKEGRSKVTGSVVIEEGDRKAYCDEAVFYEKEDKVIMTGSPKIIQKDNVFQGEKMTFFLNEDRFIIEGKVDGTIIEEKKEADKNPVKEGEKIEKESTRQ